LNFISSSDGNRILLEIESRSRNGDLIFFGVALAAPMNESPIRPPPD